MIDTHEKPSWKPLGRDEYIHDWIPRYERKLQRDAMIRMGLDPNSRFAQYAIAASPHNVHIAQNLTGFAVDFARERNTFLVNMIAPPVTVPKMIDKYYRFDFPEAYRVGDVDDDAYAGGRPGGEPRSVPWTFDTATFECKQRALRQDLAFAVEANSDFVVRQKFVQNITTQIQLRKLIRAFAQLTTANLADAAATALGGGKWDAGDATNAYLQKGINAVMIALNKATFNSVRPQNVYMLINPTTAAAIGASAEVRAYVQNSINGTVFLQGQAPFQGMLSGGQYNIPANLFGVNTVVVDSLKLTSAEGAADTTAYVCPDDQAIFVHVDSPGLASYSTLTCFEWAPFMVEAHDIPWEKRTSLQVHNSYDLKLTAAASGYVATDVLT